MTSAGYGQAFGRFGYEQSVALPGLKIDKEGFAAADPIADKIRFAVPSKDWKPSSTSEIEQIVNLSGRAGCPSQAMFNLAGLGFSLYFPLGIDLRIGTLGAPYLSWEQGTVGENVATPETRWLVISFRDRQPSVVLGFPNGAASLSITGKAGSWAIKSQGKFKGWVRVGLPQGLDAQLANTAASLGRIAKAASAQARFWTSMPPRLLKTSLASDLHSVTATWQFDQTGAVVPPAADLAYIGGYPLTIQTPTSRLSGWTESGPTDVVTGSSLTIRFPVRRVPTGRCLTIGTLATQPLGSASFLDIPSVARLALETLSAGRDSLTNRSAQSTTNEYITQAGYSLEPWSGQQLPFDRTGKGIDLAAAHALLAQAVTSTSKSTSESNSLLTSVCWRQDWLTWRVWVPDEATAQRAGALASMAGALCPEPERRLAAAMFQAGLSGYRGLNVWKKRKGLIDQTPKLIEPLYGLRKGLFGLQGPEEDGESFAKSLLSPLRIFSESPVTLLKQGPDYALQTDPVEAKQYVIMLASAYPIEIKSLNNVSYIKVVSALGFTEIHYIPQVTGLCEFKLILPSYAQPPPPISPVPNYSETAR